jgi:hypothetical protein
MFFLQQQPIVVDVIKQPTPTRDISIDYVITMFQTAGVFCWPPRSGASSSAPSLSAFAA